MNLFLAILFKYLKNEPSEITLSPMTVSTNLIQVVFPNLSVSLLDILRVESFTLARDIQHILEDGRFSSPQDKLAAIEDLFAAYDNDSDLFD